MARLVKGLGATGFDSGPEEDELEYELEGSSRRRGLVCVTGELSTASRTGSKAGIPSPSKAAQHNKSQRLWNRSMLEDPNVVVAVNVEVNVEERTKA